jgi:hypothetical protein
MMRSQVCETSALETVEPDARCLLGLVCPEQALNPTQSDGCFSAELSFGFGAALEVSKT